MKVLVVSVRGNIFDYEAEEVTGCLGRLPHIKGESQLKKGAS